MRRYSGEGLSTRVYGGEAERRSRDAWGKHVSSATRAGHRGCWHPTDEPSPSRSDHLTRSCQCLSIKGQDMATYLVSRRVLSPVEWDHVMVVGESHIETSEYLGLIVV